MDTPTYYIEPGDDDIVLESTDIVVRESKPLIQMQATVSSFWTRLKGSVASDLGLENILMEGERANKDVAYEALKEYLVKRNANHITKLIYRSLLDGVKPKYTKVSAIKHRFQFIDRSGDPINAYDVILVKL